ncbi:hypothetical protein C8Q74DRAFT_79914 [Fomes fomentarius]|nr:hypothetical protein C8Q74DRAFT_79914 [Fomes fomentarius]
MSSTSFVEPFNLRLSSDARYSRSRSPTSTASWSSITYTSGTSAEPASPYLHAQPQPQPPHVSYESNPSRTVTPSSTLQPRLPSSSPSAIDVLRIACMRGDLSVLPQLIAAAVNPSPHTCIPSPSPAVFQQLLASLSAVGIDFTAALCHPLRCTRCGSVYCEIENGTTACAVQHQPPLVCSDPDAGIWVGNQLCEARYYWCCGTAEVVPPSRPVGGMCFVGRHTAQDLDPAFNSEQDILYHSMYERGGYDAQAGADLVAQVPQSLRTMPCESPWQAQAQVQDVLELSYGAPLQPPTPLPATLRWFADTNATGDWYGASTSQQEPLGEDVAAPTPTLGTSTAPRITSMIPCGESSLYHPPGWIVVPAALRHPGCPLYV